MAGLGVVDVNFQRYCNCMHIIGQREMCRVFLYLWHHHQPDRQKSISEVLADIPGGFARLGNIQQAALAQRECPTKMDITLLYILLQRTCGLKPDPPQNSVWNNPSSDEERQRLEHKLYQIKELRNHLTHEPRAYMNMSEQELKDKVGKLEQLYCQVVKKAATNIGHSQQRADAITTKISNDLQDILTSSRSSGYHPQEWVSLAREEQRGTTHNHLEFFAEPLVKLPQGQWVGAGEEDMLARMLSWRCLDGTLPQLIQITGEAGVGKTTLCQQAWKSWMAGGDVDGGCDLVLRVQCGQVTTRDVARLVKEELLPGSCHRCDHSQVLELLGSVRILWLVDGLEDAAPEAFPLLQAIMDKFSDKHVVLVTCQPSFTQKVTSVVTNQRVCEVNLKGLSNNGTQKMLQHLLQGEDITKFAHDSDQLQLIKYLKYEAFNPLKLKLAVKLWKKGNLNIEAGATLPDLYQAVEEAQVKKVSDILVKMSGLTKSEAHERVSLWLKELYKVAFNMTVEKELVLLSECKTESLKKESIRILPSYTECFSAFLTCLPDTTLPVGCHRYSFIHATEQRYFAAQHVCHEMASHPNPITLLSQTLRLDQANEGDLDYFYEFILLVLSSFVAKNISNDKTEDFLISTLSKCKRCNWLEVVHSACHSEKIARRVSQYMPDTLQVTEIYLLAAILLLNHAAPKQLLIDIDVYPGDLLHLMPFLKVVANTDARVHLKFPYYLEYKINDFCDKYLQLLVNQESSCMLLEFVGLLSASACLTYLQSSSLLSLVILVPDMNTLQSLMQVTNTAVNLQILHMISPATELNTSFIRPRSGISISIEFIYIQDQHLPMVTKVLQCMAKNYDTILLSYVSSKEALNFVKRLETSGIQVAELRKGLTMNLDVNNVKVAQDIKIPCGPIPIKYSNKTFKQMWDQHHLNYEVLGDQLTFSLNTPDSDRKRWKT